MSDKPMIKNHALCEAKLRAAEAALSEVRETMRRMQESNFQAIADITAQDVVEWHAEYDRANKAEARVAQLQTTVSQLTETKNLWFRKANAFEARIRALEMRLEGR